MLSMVLIQAAPTGVSINGKTSIIIWRLECCQPPTELTVTEFLIPLPLDGIHWRDKLFSLNEEIAMQTEKFDEVWPLVNEVYLHHKNRVRAE